MKLATYHDGSRDGQLVVVSRDLSLAHFANGIATRLQQVLDDWNFLSPQLQDLSVTLNQGKARHAFAFEPRQCMAPLPRAHHCVSSAAYPGFGDRLRRAAGDSPSAEGPRAAGTVGTEGMADPGLIHGAGDDLLGPCAAVRVDDPAAGPDFAAGLAVVTGDVARGIGADEALDAVRLVMLANEWHLRQQPAPAHAAWLATAFGPVAVTPDELGDAWQGGRVHLPLQVGCNGKRVGLCDAGADMRWHFGLLIAELARARRLQAGTVIGSGPVSQQDATRGICGIAEKRALEVLQDGAPRTGFLHWGDAVRIEMKGRDGMSVFGAIDQVLRGPAGEGAVAEDEGEAAVATADPDAAAPVQAEPGADA